MLYKRQEKISPKECLIFLWSSHILLDICLLYFNFQLSNSSQMIDRKNVLLSMESLFLLFKGHLVSSVSLKYLDTFSLGTAPVF